MTDFLLRIDFIRDWVDNGPPNIFWISGFFQTQSFLTGTLQNFSRKNKIPIDNIEFNFRFLSTYDDKIDTPAKEGCYVHGLFVDGARWDLEKKCLTEPFPEVLQDKFPQIQLVPQEIRISPIKMMLTDF